MEDDAHSLSNLNVLHEYIRLWIVDTVWKRPPIDLLNKLYAVIRPVYDVFLTWDDGKVHGDEAIYQAFKTAIDQMVKWELSRETEFWEALVNAVLEYIADSKDVSDRLESKVTEIINGFNTLRPQDPDEV